MPWVEFSRTFRWRPTAHVSIRYSPGMRLNVTRRCAAAAVQAGAAARSTDPAKERRDGARNDDHGAGEAPAEA